MTTNARVGQNHARFSTLLPALAVVALFLGSATPLPVQAQVQACVTGALGCIGGGSCPVPPPNNVFVATLAPCQSPSTSIPSNSVPCPLSTTPDPVACPNSLPPGVGDAQDAKDKTVAAGDDFVHRVDPTNGTIPSPTQLEMESTQQALGKKLDAYKSALLSGALPQVSADALNESSSASRRASFPTAPSSTACRS